MQFYIKSLKKIKAVKINNIKPQPVTSFNACAIKDPALLTWGHEILSKWHIYTYHFHPLGGGGSRSPTSHQPSSLFLTTTNFLSKSLIPFPPAYPHLAFLWPPVHQNPWHLTPSPILPLTAPSSVNMLLLSLLPDLSLTLGHHFPLPALCSKRPTLAHTWHMCQEPCASTEEISAPPSDPLLKVFSCFFRFLLSQLVFCMLRSCVCVPFYKAGTGSFCPQKKTLALPANSPVQVFLVSHTPMAASPFPSYFVQVHNFSASFVNFSHWGF